MKKIHKKTGMTKAQDTTNSISMQ